MDFNRMKGFSSCSRDFTGVPGICKGIPMDFMGFQENSMSFKNFNELNGILGNLKRFQWVLRDYKGLNETLTLKKDSETQKRQGNTKETQILKETKQTQ